MPNWCENELTVRGDGAMTFYEENKEEGEKDLSFAKSVPMPEGEDWYSWNIDHWGTKWDACDTHYAYHEGEASYGFDTAWGPPEKWLVAVGQKYPNLRFTLDYSEPNMNFRGRMVVEEGEVVEEYCGEYGEEAYHALEAADAEAEDEREPDE